MKFSTKVIEKMGEILAGEMKDNLVGAAGLKRYLETRDESQAMEKEKE